MMITLNKSIMLLKFLDFNLNKSYFFMFRLKVVLEWLQFFK